MLLGVQVGQGCINEQGSSLSNRLLYETYSLVPCGKCFKTNSKARVQT